MLKQSIPISYQMMYFLLLLFTLVNVFGARSDILHDGKGGADPPSRKVVEFNVQIDESGVQYNQTVEVNTEKQTELFKVPAHSNVDQSNILHDFNTNLSLLLLPEKRICYLLPLNMELSPPTKLISDHNEAEITGTKIIENNWVKDGEVNDRTILGDEFKAHCAEYPIYFVKKVEDFSTTAGIQTDGRIHRKRRVVSLQILRSMAASYVDIEERGLICPGGKGKIVASDVESCVFGQSKSWKVKCKRFTSSCYWIKVCDTFDECYDKHLRNTVFCCEHMCTK